MRIVDLSEHDRPSIDQAAALLLDGFAETGSASWHTLEEAVAAVRESLQEGCLSRIAVENSGQVLGWIAGSPRYGGHAWELHPLVVRRDCRGRGIGRALVGDLEEQIGRRGGLTLYLGTDDENGRTSLGGVDLYPDVLGALSAIRNLRQHPVEFYQKMGFVIVGALQDANGF